MKEYGTFQIASGYCHVLGDHIIFNFSKDTFEPDENKNGIFRNKIADIIIVSIIVGLIIYNTSKGDYFSLFIFMGMVLAYYGWPILKKTKTSKVAKIALQDIQYIDYKLTKLGETYGYFEIIFSNQSSKKQMKKVEMPSFEHNGTIEIEKAKTIFASHGLLN